MKKLILTTCILILNLNTYGQAKNNKYAKDVISIDAIINAYYEVISGSSSDAWQFERDNYIHANTARITKLDDEGKVSIVSLEAEYVPLLLSPREDFYEIEIHRSIQSYGNMAHVWSIYEIRSNPEVPSEMRGVNSIQLYFSEGRWWISNWTTQLENAHPIPEKYLK